MRLQGIGVGLVGTGYMGKCHALAWNAVAPVFGDVPRPRLLHLADADQGLAERRAAELGFVRASGDWRRLIDDPDVEVVSITTPNALHAEMAIAALQAGKHVWCEKPMATRIEDAAAMRAAARASGSVAVLGYNYIQNPIIRHMRRLIAEGTIGTVNQIRLEMDEDFMADPDAPFGWKDQAASGYGALDDFGVHPLSLIHALTGSPVARVVADMSRPVAERRTVEGGRRAVETHDTASVLLRLENGVAASLLLDRAAWGRKGRIALQVFGTAGSLLFDQERFNEVQLYVADGPAASRGFRTILAGPEHPPYGRFCPAPGHGLGFNDLKAIECRELMARIAGETASVIDFEVGYAIEAAVHAMARSHAERTWTAV